MRHSKSKILAWASRLGWATAGVVAAGLYIYYLQAQSLPELQFWHREDVAEDIVPELEKYARIELPEYLEHEAQIFAQLDQLIAETNADLPGWHRYSAAAYAIYRAAWPDNNRTQLRVPEGKKGGVLLAHGLSDSTHSMRALAAFLDQQGYATLNLRIPGHGTIPGALRNVTWRQFRGAYRMGARALAGALEPGQPMILVGYSNGAALAVEYTLSTLLGDVEGRVPDLLVLVSPAMQVSPLAAYARVQRLISELPGMEKLGWTDVVAEFDPFKYNSFPVYAGEQIFKLTSSLADKFTRLTPEQLGRFPRVLAFHSVLDATIAPSGVVSAFLDRLGDTPAELVLFDINRNSGVLPLLADHGESFLRLLSDDSNRRFTLTMVGSNDSTTDRVAIRTRQPGQDTWQVEHTAMRWPHNVYSLSHVALPFPDDDPIYGRNRGDGMMRLGEFWMKGERGALGVPLGLLARQRYNPFFPYLEARVVEAVEDLTSAEPRAR